VNFRLLTSINSAISVYPNAFQKTLLLVRPPVCRYAGNLQFDSVFRRYLNSPNELLGHGENLRKINPDAFSKVNSHVKQQSHADQSGIGKCCQNAVQQYGNIRMQWMKIDTATIWVVNRIGHQVIEVHDHCQYHDQPR
jgi:hypothetical protein